MEEARSGTANWWVSYGFDRWGNRWVKDLRPGSSVETSGVTLDGRTPTVATNYNAKNQLVAAGPDLAGNETANYSLSYDGENRVITASAGIGHTVAYAYDGDGRRVSKTMDPGTGAASTTSYVYDAAGQLAVEYATSAAAGACSTCYLFGDHLGSTRAVWNSGGVWSRMDYYPFGEPIPGSANGRSGAACAPDVVSCYPSNGQASQSLSVSELFTGKKRDSESGLDYFGARYMSSAQGRFTTPDPSRLSAFIDSPQSWNMYVYAYNNPLKFVDKNGMWPTPIHNQIIDAAFGNLTDAQRQILKDVSARQDSILAGGQGNAIAFQHAMSEPGQSAVDAQSEYQDFVTANQDQATKTQINFWTAGNRGLSDSALAKFAVSLHAVLDSTSPAHLGFHTWDWKNPALVARHHFAENSITGQQLNSAITAAQRAFSSTFEPKFNVFDFLLLQSGSQPRSQKAEVTTKVCYSLDDGKQSCQ